MNGVFLFLIAVSVLFGAFTGKMEAVTMASFDAAKGAITLAIGLTGPMVLWLGLVKVAEKGGLLAWLSRVFHPILRWLFHGIPEGHPAMSAMVMNLAANCLGLGNAATPLGIKAMVELEKLNPHPGRATDPMCLFLAINTSSVTLLPLGVIAVRAAAGAKDPANIILPTLFATAVSTITAVVVAKVLGRLNPEGGEGDRGKSVASPPQSLKDPDLEDFQKAFQATSPRRPPLAKTFSAFVIGLLIIAAVYRLTQGPVTAGLKELSSFWLVPMLMLGLLLFGYLKGVRVYEAACEGAKEGVEVVIKIIPFLVMILVTVGMLRASGAFEYFSRVMAPLTGLIGFPPDVLPVALIRPLSGSGAFGLMSEIVQRAPDSFSAYLASTIQGSTETTFYVLAVYFGAVGIKDPRYALWAALSGDAAGALAALFICKMTF